MSYLGMSSEQVEDCVARFGLDDDMFFSLHDSATSLITKLFDALCARHDDDLVDELKEEYGL
jgi:hypothetical protein